MRSRTEHERLSIAEFWRYVEPRRRPADLYENMTLYDAKNDRIIVLERPEANGGRTWAFFVDGEPDTLFTLQAHSLCRLMEA